jgi:hypothetical protein
VQPTTSHDHLPALGQQIAYQTHRDGVAARFAEPAGPKRLEIDLALIGSSDEWLRDLDLALVKAARPHDANTRYRLRTVPGIGKILSLVWLTTFMIWSASRGCRSWPPTVASSRVPRNLLAKGTAPQGPTSARPIARGCSPKPPSDACGIIPLVRHF